MWNYGETSSNYFRWYFYVSDGGPDQVTFAKHLLFETARSLRVLVVTFRCVTVLLQLSFPAGLKIMDALRKRLRLPWTYFAGLTKMTHF